MRIDCEKFTGIQQPEPHYARQYIGKLKPGMFAYTLANEFCFLTGEEGYTPEKNPERWVKK